MLTSVLIYVFFLIFNFPILNNYMMGSDSLGEEIIILQSFKIGIEIGIVESGWTKEFDMILGN